jgi:hypothetical protein
MSANDHLSPAQFDPESRPAHENYGITYTNGDERRGVPATSRLGERNQSIRESSELGESDGRARQVYNARSPRAVAAKRLGTEANYIRGLRPVTPYGNANQN